MLEKAFEIVHEIRDRGHLAVIVGGAVRDLLLGRPLTDVDIATDMPPDELAESSRPTRSAARGRSRPWWSPAAATPSKSPGFGLDMAKPARRSPFDPLREDTAHRDFTINALLMGADGARHRFSGRTRGSAGPCGPLRRFARGALRRRPGASPARRAFCRMSRFH